MSKMNVSCWRTAGYFEEQHSTQPDNLCHVCLLSLGMGLLSRVHWQSQHIHIECKENTCVCPCIPALGGLVPNPVTTPWGVFLIPWPPAWSLLMISVGLGPVPVLYNTCELRSCLLVIVIECCIGIYAGTPTGHYCSSDRGSAFPRAPAVQNPKPVLISACSHIFSNKLQRMRSRGAHCSAALAGMQ